MAALTAGVLGPALHHIDTSTALGFAQKAIGHAVVGGALSGAANLAQGGSFRDGFVGAFVAQLASPYIKGIGGDGFEGSVVRVAATAAVGGTAAELGGGKFANGAVSAAFLRLYNEEMARQVAIKMTVQRMEYKADRTIGTFRLEAEGFKPVSGYTLEQETGNYGKGKAITPEPTRLDTAEYGGGNAFASFSLQGAIIRFVQQVNDYNFQRGFGAAPITITVR